MEASSSSATSSVMVSKAGELEGFVGKIIGAGATSIHELRFLIPLAILMNSTTKYVTFSAP